LVRFSTESDTGCDFCPETDCGNNPSRRKGRMVKNFMEGIFFKVEKKEIIKSDE
jgi:hypothetical protein